VEKSGSGDAAVVVAVERHPTLPAAPGARRSGEDWARFFPTVLGVRPERVTTLFDGAGTRDAILSAVHDATARVAPGGRLWFVVVGHGTVGEDEIASAAARPDVQLVLVLDTVTRGAPKSVRSAPPVKRPGTLPPIRFSMARATPLPGASRPALSYLVMGALRGWGDRDHDARVTSSETATYVDAMLALLARHRNPPVGVVGATSDLVCSELTTLSVAREPSPNVLEIVPRVPLGPHAEPEALKEALEAVRGADAQLEGARAWGPLKGIPEPREPQFTGEGEQRRVEVVAMPREVTEAARVRLEWAKRLGGPKVREVAPLLVEAGRLRLVYGQLDEARRILTPVLEARCGADAAGYQAWEHLIRIATWTGDDRDARRLVSMDCAFDEATANVLDGVRHPLSAPSWWSLMETRELYERAEGQTDPVLSRCTWARVAADYSSSWKSDSESSSSVEPALNGAHAYRRLGRTDAAAGLYRSYVRKQGGARAGESPSAAKARRKYALAACAAYLELARADARLFPGYFDACRDVHCTGMESSECAQLTAGAIVQAAPASPEIDRARRLSLAALDREELAGWETTDAARTARLREASQQYAAAEAAWQTVVDQEIPAPDAVEAARRLTEAGVRRLLMDLRTGADVTDGAIEKARSRARFARDVTIDERRGEPAQLLVELADELLAREHRAFGASHGERGVAPQVEVRFEGEGDERRVMKDEIPAPVSAAIATRDEYLAHVPATLDPGEARYRVAYEAGRLLFRYGHFAEARAHLELPFTMECGKAPLGYDAWELLISIANLQQNVAWSRALADGAGACTSDVETRIRFDRLRRPAYQSRFALEGRFALQESEKLPEGPERRTKRREAAAIFREFVDETPLRDDAPESALIAAGLYAELAEEARAIEMYRLFVDRYGNEATLSTLEKGAPKASPPVAKDPKQYASRVADLERAYAALAKLHAATGDYRAAARVLAEESERKRLPRKARAQAAQAARDLRADRDGSGSPAS
jgi:hypothetical protein